MWGSSATVTARAQQSCRPTATLAVFLLSDIQTFFRRILKMETSGVSWQRAMCFSSQPSPALPYQVSAEATSGAQVGGRREGEEEIPPAQYKYYWGILGSVSLSCGWNCSLEQRPAALSSPSLSLSLCNSLPFPLSLSAIRHTTSEQVLICRENWASEMLPLSAEAYGKVFWDVICSLVNWLCSGTSSLFWVLKNTHMVGHGFFFHSFFFQFSPPFPPFLLSLPDGWGKKGFNVSDGLLGQRSDYRSRCCVVFSL